MASQAGSYEYFLRAHLDVLSRQLRNGRAKLKERGEPTGPEEAANLRAELAELDAWEGIRRDVEADWLDQVRKRRGPPEALFGGLEG